MSKRTRNGEVRVLTGSGYLAGDLDARDAGPIPESAGIKIVPKKTATKSVSRRASKTRKRATSS